MTTPEFDEAYRGLNPEQKKAVDTVEGPVMVVAGPGTGKTQVLTLRIANILLKTDTKPENILALTYTESGAHAMKKRLAALIGSSAYRVTISTFHGFANELIGRFPEKFPAIIGGLPATEVEQIMLMKRLLDDGTAKPLRLPGDPYYYVDPALRAIHTLKREGFSPEEFAKLLTREENALSAVADLYHEKGAHKGKKKGKYIEIEESLTKAHALHELYETYQKELRIMKRFDYEDMILETVRAMESDKDFLTILQEEYQYLLADEHQDTNNAQNRILELLASYYDIPNLFIVGDEKQAIYRFQGASLANFLYFREKYLDVLSITLTENYRSTQNILDSAHALIGAEGSADELRLRLPLIARSGGKKEKIDAPILVAHLSTPRREMEYVAEHIVKRVKEGDSAEEIAVLARKNTDIRELAILFAKRGIPYHMLSEQDVLLDEDVGKFVRLLRAVVEYGDDVALVPAMRNDFLKFDHLDIWKIIHTAEKKKKTIHELIRNASALKEAGVENPAPFIALSKCLHDWHVGMSNQHVLPLVERILRESGLLADILSKREGSARLSSVDRLYDELQSLAAREPEYSLASFLLHLDTLREHGKSLETSSKEERMGVRLMSAHKAKGLEFDHVYILNATERAWEGRGKRVLFRTHLVPSPLEDTQDRGDERRLFYVALTRARKTATITVSEVDQNGKPAISSRFITDIDPRLLRHETPDTGTSRGKGEQYQERVHLEPRALDRDYLRARLLEQGFSATALNNFLTCPWQYVHRSLLRVPAAPDKYLVFGTAVHAALHVFFDAWKEGEDIGAGKMIERFRFTLERQPLSSADTRALLEKGEEALFGYHRFYGGKAGSWGRNIRNEYRIKGVGVTIDTDDGPIGIGLSGSLDKLEIADDGTVDVIDYKTGKVKSRKTLLGETKEGNRDYLRQLAFYKLLLLKSGEGDVRERFDMRTGTIEFIQPSESGKYIREVFEVTDADAQKVEGEVVSAAQAVYELSFWGRGCGDEQCEYCPLYVPLAEQKITGAPKDR